MKKIIIQKREIEKKNLMNETIIQANQRDCINQLFLDEIEDGVSPIWKKMKKYIDLGHARMVYREKLYKSIVFR